MRLKKDSSEQKLRGAYYTPLQLADAMVSLFASDNIHSVLEPSCGDGVFLDSLRDTDLIDNIPFIQAVETILGYSNDRPPVLYQQPKKVQNVRLILPKKSTTTDKVMSYLIGRGIDKDIISECIDNRLIYEDLPNHNVVFVGYDKNKVPRYAGVRATNNSRYMKDVYGSHKAFSFKLDSIEKSDTVHLFESAIDLLSYATLNKLENKEWYNDNLLSLAGVYQPAKKIDESKIPLALNYYLNQNQNIKKIYLHFDNDSAGRIATMALKTVLPKQYEVIDDPPKIGKDFNDFLCAKVGINYKKRYEKER